MGYIGLKEAEEKTGIPSRSIRRYIKNHGQWLPVAKEGQKYNIAEHGLPLLLHIRERYGQGMTVDQVNKELEERGDSVIEVDRVTDPTADPEQLKQFFKAIVERQENRIKELENKVDNLTQLIEDGQRQHQNIAKLQAQKTGKDISEQLEKKLEERDKKLMETIRELQEQKKPWWKLNCRIVIRLFILQSQTNTIPIIKGFSYLAH